MEQGEDGKEDQSRSYPSIRRETFAKDEPTERDRHDGVDVCMRGYGGRGAVFEQKNIGGVSNNRAEDSQVGEGGPGTRRDLVNGYRFGFSEAKCSRQANSAAADHLHARVQPGVGFDRISFSVNAAARPREDSDNDQHVADELALAGSCIWAIHENGHTNKSQQQASHSYTAWPSLNASQPAQ